MVKRFMYPGNDIDTDRIIPARFLKCVTFDELGPSLFYDERFAEDGTSKDHPLDKAQNKGAEILMSDDNFGCGSSREHAPQAIQKFGLKAVIAGSFAEIFHGNCTTLGIPCLMMEKADREKLASSLAMDPEGGSCHRPSRSQGYLCKQYLFNQNERERKRSIAYIDKRPIRFFVGC